MSETGMYHGGETGLWSIAESFVIMWEEARTCINTDNSLCGLQQESANHFDNS